MNFFNVDVRVERLGKKLTYVSVGDDIFDILGSCGLGLGLD